MPQKEKAPPNGSAFNVEKIGLEPTTS